jgi:diamine N-acetyltransferase
VPLSLRPTRPEDLDHVLALEADPDVSAWTATWPRERHLQAISDEDEAHLSIFEGPRHAGFALLIGVHDRNRAIELRRIALAQRGAGAGAQALDLVLDHAFGTCEAHRVWLDVMPGNARAQRVYERAGFVCEGVAREAHLLPDGSFAPLRVMSILVHEWRGGDGPRADSP